MVATIFSQPGVWGLVLRFYVKFDVEYSSIPAPGVLVPLIPFQHSRKLDEKKLVIISVPPSPPTVTPNPRLNHKFYFRSGCDAVPESIASPRIDDAF